TLSNDGPINEGSPGNLSFSGQFDPSTADTTAGFHYAYDFDNDGTWDVGGATYAAGVTSATASIPASFLDDGPASLTMKGRIIDKDGGFTDYTTLVVVNNVDPTATLSNDGPINEGSPGNLSFSGQFDPSTADTTAGFHYAYDFDNDGTWDVGGATYAAGVTSATASIPASFLDDGPASLTMKGRI